MQMCDCSEELKAGEKEGYLCLECGAERLAEDENVCPECEKNYLGASGGMGLMRWRHGD